MTYGNNFNALKIYISHQQREQPRRPPVLSPSPMQVTTLAVTDATLLNDIEWAVVDVETTGLSFKWCRVIDVAAVVLGKGSQRGENDGVGAAPHTAFQTLVNPLPPYLANSPHSSPTLPPVPKRISELTGITPEVPTLRCVLTFLHVRPPPPPFSFSCYQLRPHFQPLPLHCPELSRGVCPLVRCLLPPITRITC